MKNIKTNINKEIEKQTKNAERYIKIIYFIFVLILIFLVIRLIRGWNGKNKFRKTERVRDL